jgi:hypothetical protein
LIKAIYINQLNTNITSKTICAANFISQLLTAKRAKIPRYIERLTFKLPAKTREILGLRVKQHEWLRAITRNPAFLTTIGAKSPPKVEKYSI